MTSPGDLDGLTFEELLQRLTADGAPQWDTPGDLSRMSINAFAKKQPGATMSSDNLAAITGQIERERVERGEPMHPQLSVSSRWEDVALVLARRLLQVEADIAALRDRVEDQEQP